MSRCLITYEPVEGDRRYSDRGLRLLARNLRGLEPLQFTAGEMLAEAARRAGRMSIGGVQPKLSAVLEQTNSRFRVVDTGGRYIIKPPHPAYPELPQNEDLTMRLAAAAGIDVPFHCLAVGRDGARSYITRRFDRVPRAPGSVPVEDFAQLSGRSRETKYDSSVEQVIRVIEEHCTFARLELSRLYMRVLFCFLVGNEDMHLKNYSLITTDGKVTLSPAYDLVNTTLALPPDAEESALPIGGKREGLTRKLLVDYLGRERCGLPPGQIEATLSQLREATGRWRETIAVSFLSEPVRNRYLRIISERSERLFT